LAEISVCVGRVCRSKSGRDKGRYFLIKEIVDDQYVYVVDGVVRRLAKPKLKKLKHLELRHQVMEHIAAKFQAGAKVFDAEVNSAIHSLGYYEQR